MKSCIFVLRAQRIKHIFLLFYFFGYKKQLTLKLALGVVFEVITLVVLTVRVISSLANIRFAYAMGPGFESLEVHQEKRPFSNGLFSIQSKGLACNLTAGEYVIAEGVWHHASACIFLRK